MKTNVYGWYNNGRLIVKSVDTERNIFIKGSMTQEYFDIRIGNKKHYEGDLRYLGETQITSLGKLETISGSVAIFRSKKITSLGNLRMMDGDLSLFWSKITSLGELEHVGGNLSLINTDITDLGNLKSVGGVIHYTNDSSTHKLLMDSKFRDQAEAIDF